MYHSDYGHSVRAELVSGLKLREGFGLRKVTMLSNIQKCHGGGGRVSERTDLRFHTLPWWGNFGAAICRNVDLHQAGQRVWSGPGHRFLLFWGKNLGEYACACVMSSTSSFHALSIVEAMSKLNVVCVAAFQVISMGLADSVL